MNKKSFTWLFLVPLIVICYGIWQHYRVSDIGARIDLSDQLLPAAEQALQSNPNAQLDFTWEGEQYQLPARDIVNQERSFRNQYSSEIVAAKTQRGLSSFGIVMAIFSLALNLGAFALCRQSVNVAKRSQDDLIRAFDRCRKLLPFIMVAQLICCGLGIFSMLAYETIWFATHFRMNAGGVKVMFIALCAMGGILWMLVKSLGSVKKCFAIFQPEPMPVAGVNLRREQAPALWQWVEALAQRLNSVVPDNIVAGVVDGFYVTASPVQLAEGELLKGNTLYFPLTWAALLDQEEASAVVGHELGHFSGQDTEYSLRFAPLYAGIKSSIETFGERQGGTLVDYVVLYPSLYMGVHFIQQLHETVSHWSRIREHAADESGARASSPQALASSLLRISSASEVVDESLEALYQGEKPESDLVTSLVAKLRERGISDPRRHLENQAAHPTDSHPPCSVRIDALGCAIDQPLLARAARPVEADAFGWLNQLIPDAPVLAARLTHELTGRIQTHLSEYRQELEQVVEQAAEQVTLFTSKSGPIVGALCGLLLLALALVMAVMQFFGPFSELSFKLNLLLVAFGAMGVVALNLAWQTWQKRDLPFMTITPDTLLCRQFDGVIPLNAITDFSFQANNGMVYLTLNYKEGFEPPKVVGGWWKNRMRQNRKTRKMVIQFAGRMQDRAGNRAWNLEQLVELLSRNLNACWAREALSSIK